MAVAIVHGKRHLSTRPQRFARFFPFIFARLTLILFSSNHGLHRVRRDFTHSSIVRIIFFFSSSSFFLYLSLCLSCALCFCLRFLSLVPKTRALCICPCVFVRVASLFSFLFLTRSAFCLSRNNVGHHFFSISLLVDIFGTLVAMCTVIRVVSFAPIRLEANVKE